MALDVEATRALVLNMVAWPKCTTPPGQLLCGTLDPFSLLGGWGIEQLQKGCGVAFSKMPECLKLWQGSYCPDVAPTI